MTTISGRAAATHSRRRLANTPRSLFIDKLRRRSREDATLGRVRSRGSAAAIGVFALLAVVHLWPVAGHLTTRVLDDGDSLLSAASFASTARLLASRPLHVFDMNMYFPYRLSLATLDHQVVNAILAAPVMYALDSPAAGLNALIVISFVAGGYGAFLLTREVTGSAIAGLISGVIYGFSPVRLENLQHTHVLAGFWLPFVLFALHRFVDCPNGRRSAALVVFSLVQAFASWYSAITAAIAVIVVASFELARRREAWTPVFKFAAGGVLVGALAITPLALPYVRLPHAFSPQAPHPWEIMDSSRRGENIPETNSIEQRRPSGGVLLGNSASLDSYLAPASTANGLWRPLLGRFATVQGDNFLGAVALALVVVGLAASTASAAFGTQPNSGRALAPRTGYRSPAPAAVMQFCDASFDPRGRHRVFAVLTRVSGRLASGFGSIAVAAVVAVATGHHGGILVTLARESHAVAVGFALVLVWLWVRLFANGPESWPGARGPYLALALVGFTLSLGPTVFVRQISLGAGVYSSEVPPLNLLRAPGRLGDLYALGMAILAGFGVAILLGRLSGRVLRGAAALAIFGVVNAELFAWWTPAAKSVPRVPTIFHLLERQPEGAVVEFPIHKNGWSVYWPWFHRRPVVNGYGTTEPFQYARLKDVDELSPDMVEHLRTYFHPRHVVVDTLLYDHDRLAQVQKNIAHNGDGLRLLAMAGGSILYELRDQSRGPMVARSYPRWMIAGKQGFSVDAAVGAAPPGQDPVLTVWFNGAHAATISSAAVNASHHLQLPLPSVDADLLNIDFISDYRVRPGSVRPPIGTTGRTSPADIAVSAGVDRTTLRVNGRSWVGPKGYTVAVIAGDGRVDDIVNFNTSWYEDASHRLARYIAAIPPDQVVVIASNFDVSRSLTEDAVAALGTLGLVEDMRGRFQRSHAGIGIKGARAGSVVEASGDGSIDIRVGEPSPPEITIADLQFY